jgi:hypothetical protein
MELEPTVLTHHSGDPPNIGYFPNQPWLFLNVQHSKIKIFKVLLKLGPDFPFSSFQLLATLTHNINIGGLSLGALLGYFMRV